MKTGGIGEAFFILTVSYMLSSLAAAGIKGSHRIKSDLIMNMLSELLLLVMVISLIGVRGLSGVYAISLYGIQAVVIISGISILLFAMYDLYKAIIENKIKETVGYITLVLSYSMTIGLSEELLFRGLIQRSFTLTFGTESALKAFLGVLIPSIAFGSIHLLNALSPKITLKQAAVQTYMATLIGICFALLYIKSGMNIWVMAFIHGVWDFCGFASTGLLDGRRISVEEAVAINVTKALNKKEFLTHSMAYLVLILILLINF